MTSISYHSNQSPYPIKTKKTQLFFPPTCKWCMRNMKTIGPAVSEKKIFEIVDDDGRTDDGRTPEHGYTIRNALTVKMKMCLLHKVDNVQLFYHFRITFQFINI